MKKIITFLFIINCLLINSSSVYAQKHPRLPQRANNHTQNYPDNHSTPDLPTPPTPPIPPTPPKPSISNHHHKSPAIYSQGPVVIPAPAPVPPVPPPPSKPIPPIRQDFSTNAMSMNIGQLQFNAINLSAESGAMAEGSSIEIKQFDRNATVSEIYTNCKSNRFIAVGDLYEIKTTGMNQYSGLPIKYVLMAKGNVPNDSRLFMLARLGSEIYFIPAKTIF